MYEVPKQTYCIVRGCEKVLTLEEESYGKSKCHRHMISAYKFVIAKLRDEIVDLETQLAKAKGR